MPFTDNHGIRIRYELTGDGPPLLLMHGYSGNLQRWISLGYVEALANKFQLILIDARGHGQSDKPHDSESYSWDKRTSDVIAVLNDTGISSVHIFGYSLGGIYAFNLAKDVPDRVESVITWGAHPYASTFDSFSGINGCNTEEFLTAFEQYLGEKISAPGRRLITEENDLQALVAAATDRESMSESLAGMSMPFLVMAGSEDARVSLMEKCAGELPNASFNRFEGHGHMQAKTPKEKVLEPVLAFLDQLA